jgi:biopolymer transport protein ExbB/TolQ
MEQQGLNLIEIMHKGALATYPLILLSIVSVTVVFERLWSLRNIRSTTLRIAESLVDPVQKGHLQTEFALSGGKNFPQCSGESRK